MVRRDPRPHYWGCVLNALRQSEEKHLEWHTVNRILDAVLNALRQSVGK